MARPLTALKALAARLARRGSRLRDALAAWRALALSRPARLRWTPEPLRVGEPETAAQAAAGVVLAAGARVALGEGRALASRAPTPAAADAVLGFDWLDEAHAAARPDRRALRDRALGALARTAGGGWRADRAGRRLARLVSAAPLLGAEPAGAQMLARAVGAHLAFLSARAGAAEPGIPALWAATGFAIGALAVDDGGRLARRAAALIGRAAAGAIDRGGGVADRNPQTLGEVFALLAWAAEALRERGQPIDPRHEAALRRAGPALRALRLGDGRLPRLHGGGSGADGLLDEAFARAGAEARGPRRDGVMGVARLAAGRSVVLIDAGSPPATGAAGASPLALEFSVGRTRVIGAVGPGAGFGADWGLAARATAAHSAVEVAGVSAARLEPDGLIARAFGRRFARPLPGVTLIREESDDALWAQGEHDGYAARFGLTVARRLRLSRDGRDLRGEDTLTAADAAARAAFDRAARRGGGATPFVVRFHLAPGIDAALEADGEAAVVTLPDGARWRFRASGGALALTESVWLDDATGLRLPCVQLAVAARLENYWGRVAWAFAEAAPAQPRASRAAAAT